MNKNRMKMLLKTLIWLPVIGMAFVIFGFSKQDGEQSGGLSEKAAEVLIDIGQQLHLVEISQEQRAQAVEQLQLPIRKGAHMSEYALLGIQVYIALAVDGLRWQTAGWMAFAGTVLFACTDEIHQLFVPGRSGRVSDVLIDAAGCMIGLFLCMVLDKRRRNVLR